MSTQRLTLDNPVFKDVRFKTGYVSDSSVRPIRRRNLGYPQGLSRSQAVLQCSGGAQRTVPVPATIKTQYPRVNRPSADVASNVTRAQQGIDGFKTNTTPVPRVVSRQTQAQKHSDASVRLDIDHLAIAPTPQPAVYRDTSDGSVPRAKDRKRKRLTWQPALLYGMAAVIFSFGIAVAVGGFQANSHVAAQVKTLQKAASNEGGEQNYAGPPPSTDKPSSQAITSYTVAPDAPRYISIPKLGVHARVLPMSVNDKNQLDAPKNIHDAGWYNDSSMPGLPGAMLVDGHSGIGKTNGVFHYAAKLIRGDSITIERGDGQKFTYKVTSVSVLKVDSVDMSTMVMPDEGANEGLNIITCTGKQIPGTTSLDQRVLVQAVRGA